MHGDNEPKMAAVSHSTNEDTKYTTESMLHKPGA